MATGALAACLDPCSVRCRAELQGPITICLKPDNRKPPGRAGAFLEQPGKSMQALVPAPNSLAPAAHSSSELPRGISLICLRPSLISNSSPGLRSSMAV